MQTLEISTKQASTTTTGSGFQSCIAFYSSAFAVIFLVSLTLVFSKSIHLSGLEVQVPLTETNQEVTNLGRYAISNARLSDLPVGSNQVVFLGDSITDWWDLKASFPGKSYIGRGIDLQNTADIKLRLNYDVIELHPNATVILAGINDIRNISGYVPDEVIIANIIWMAETAQANGTKVILSSILPVCAPLQDSMPRIATVNNAIKAYCDTSNVVYLNYYAAMIGADGLLRPELASDCLHPNNRGYRLMAPLASAAIKQALGS